MHLPSLLDDLGGSSPAARQAALSEASVSGRPLPRLIAWNVARRCRIPSCAPCLLHAGPAPGPPGELSTVESLHVAHQVVAVHPAMLLLCGGDPLDREDLETIAAHAVRRGAGVAVASPGARLSERRLGTLLDAGLGGVVISLPGHPDRPHEGSSRADALAAIARARLAGLRVVAHVLLDECPREAVASLVRECAEQGASALHVELAGSERGMLAVERELAVQERRHRRGLALRVVRRGECACDPFGCRIAADGKLTACACARETVADLRRQSFSDAWFGSAALGARRSAASRDDAAAEAGGAPQLALRFDGEARDGSAP